jgi:peptidoglycan/xylan/chitin deacetylase (PgdA/CDA1 family)
MRAALTIDAEHPDRPAAPGNPERILDLLADRNVRATVFVQGRWAAANPVTASRISAAGHLVGNHSLSHAPMPELTDEGIRASLEKAAEAIQEATGVDPHPWFRCPYGDGADDERVLALLEELGYRHVGWDVDSEDWQAHDPAAMASLIVDGCLEHGDGAIILMHAWPDVTVTALPAAIDGLLSRDVELVGVDQL